MTKENKLNRDEIVRRIYLADGELIKILPEGEKIELIIVGGSAFLLKGLLTRTTKDIDTYLIKQKEVRQILESNDINDRCYSVMTRCIDLEDRKERLNLPGLERIDPYVLGDYDLVISKIGSMSIRPQDIQDIIDSGILRRLDFDILEILLKEKLAWIVRDDVLWEHFNYLKEEQEKLIG